MAEAALQTSRKGWPIPSTMVSQLLIHKGKKMNSYPKGTKG